MSHVIQDCTFYFFSHILFILEYGRHKHREVSHLDRFTWRNLLMFWHSPSKAPSIQTGRTGMPSARLRMAKVGRNSPSWPLSVLVPSGKISTLRPWRNASPRCSILCFISLRLSTMTPWWRAMNLAKGLRTWSSFAKKHILRNWFRLRPSIRNTVSR